MPNENDALNQFNKDFPLDETLAEKDELFGSQTSETSQEDKEEIPEGIKNRHIRRLEEKLNKEREWNIQQAARDAARSELDKFREETKGLDVDEKLITLYGDTENGRKAAQLHQDLLNKKFEEAEERAFTRLTEFQRKEEQEVRVNGDFIENEFESIEDEYNVDLSGSTERSATIRNAFLNFIERLSPKDTNGNIEEYADFQNAWELFQDRLEKPNNRSKDIASRSMTTSASSSQENSTQNKSNERWLREQGII